MAIDTVARVESGLDEALQSVTEAGRHFVALCDDHAIDVAARADGQATYPFLANRAGCTHVEVAIELPAGPRPDSV